MDQVRVVVEIRHGLVHGVYGSGVDGVAIVDWDTIDQNDGVAESHSIMTLGMMPDDTRRHAAQAFGDDVPCTNCGEPIEGAETMDHLPDLCAACGENETE